MSNWRIRRTVLSGVVAAVVSIGLFVPAARSQSGSALDAAGNEQRLQARVALLEARLGEIEDRLRAVEQSETGTRSASNVKTNATGSSKKRADTCSTPSYLDSSGVKHVRRECLQGTSIGNCESPFVVDMDGIKRVKPDCL